MKRLRISPALVIALLALFVSLGSTAWAATGGNFILGKANNANAKSQLTASNNGPVLGLTNSNATGANSTALSLNVPSGHPPFTTNSTSRVANLDADQLDGYSAEQLRTQADLVWYTPGPFAGKQHSFTSQGGPLLITLNGSAYGDVAGAVLSICVYIDGQQTHACAQIAENEALSHKALAPNTSGLDFVGAGNHTVTLVAGASYPHTFSDGYDVYSVSILELSH